MKFSCGTNTLSFLRYFSTLPFAKLICTLSSLSHIQLNITPVGYLSNEIHKSLLPGAGSRYRLRLPIAQGWQSNVNQAFAQDNAAIENGTAQVGAQSGIDTAGTAIAAADLGKRQEY
jgi:hypothetical protein